MTLIITAYANGHTFQVSDRVLSTFRGRDATPVWAYANKSLVLRTVDAAVVLGFTGIAYLRGMPTDRWIMDQLLLDLEAPSGPHVGLGDQTLSDLVAVLRKKLPRAIAMSRLPTEDGLLLRLELGGQKFDWRWPNGTSPFAISMEFWGRAGLVAPKVTSHHARAALRRGIDPQVLFSSPPGAAVSRWLNDQVDAGACRRQADFESMLIGALRLVADARPGSVGRDCLLIDLMVEPGGPALVAVHFESDDDTPPPTLGLMGKEFPLAFTPGLMCPTGFMTPNVQNLNLAMDPFIDMRLRQSDNQLTVPLVFYTGTLVAPSEHEVWKWRRRRLPLSGFGDEGPQLPGVHEVR